MTRMTEEQYADLMRRRSVPIARVPAAKPRKYRNTPCMSVDGKRFDSKLECRYYEQLLLRWKAGDIRWFVRRPRFELEGGVVYVADFLVVLSTGDVDVVDTKGVLTPSCRDKLKQVRARYGIEVTLVRSICQQ